MDPAKYQYQSGFARRDVAEGKAKGKIAGLTFWLQWSNLQPCNYPSPCMGGVRAACTSLGRIVKGLVFQT
jgi:hypothetical protein